MSEERKMLDDPTEMTPEARAKYIGGSDAAVILGLNPWKNRMDLFMEKRQLVQPQEASLPAMVGLELEDLVARLYKWSMGNGVCLIKPPIMVHAEFDFLRVHIDRVVVPDEEATPPDYIYGLECKTTNVFDRSEWGEEMSDFIPKMHIVQVQHAMMISGLPYFDIPVLFGNSEFRKYRVFKNDRFIEQLLNAEVAFWEDVQNNRPPEIDGSEASRRYLGVIYPDDSGEILKVTEEDELYPKFAVLKDIRDRMAILEEEKKKVQNEIISAAGSYSKIVHPFGSHSYKMNSGSVAWKAVAEALSSKVSDEEFKRLVSEKTGKPERIFRPYWKKGI